MKDFKNKNLLIISNGYPSKDGIYNSTFVKSQVDELAKYFNKVIVIAPKPFFPSLLKNIDFIPKEYRQKVYFKDYKYKNIEVYYPTYFLLPFNYFSKRVGDLAYNSTIKFIKNKKIKFDLIHAHFTWKSGYIASKLKERFNKKLVVTGHGFDVYNLPYRSLYFKNMFKYVLSSADFFITVSKKNLNIANSFIDLKNKSKVLPNLVANHFKVYNQKYCVNKLRLPKNKKILLHVGNYLVNVKNQTNLIKSIKELTKIRKDFVLYLIGKGKDEQLIKNKIHELKLNKYIKVIGPKPYAEIPYWMNAADLFLLPSYMEGNPTVLFECLACGTPFIGAKTGGSEEIITSDEYGYLLEDPNDFKSLSSLINKGLNKKWNKKKIINYSKNFNSKNIVKKIIEIYKKVYL